ncbi:MAG: hypothetical protein Q9221_002841 [Calogaya cf. arnoldii]
MAARVASARTIQILSASNLKDLDLSLKDSYGNTADDYLANRKFVGQDEMEIRAAFTEFERSCGSGGRPYAGPDRPKVRLIDLDDVEAQDLKDKHQPPGAFPEPAGQHDRLKEEDVIPYVVHEIFDFFASDGGLLAQESKNPPASRMG